MTGASAPVAPPWIRPWLKYKHPEPAPYNEAAFEHEPPDVHPVVFDEITAESVWLAAMNTKGGAGPSGIDADGWRHILVSRNFGQSSEELRREIAMLIQQLCVEKVDLFTSNYCFLEPRGFLGVQANSIR